MTLRYYYIQAKSYTPGRKAYGGIVLHSSDGHKMGDIETLTKGKVSSHWYIDKSGVIYHFVADSDTAYHAGKAIADWGNNSTIGIESEHIDNAEPWPEKQIQSFANLIAALRQKHGPMPYKGHSEIAVPKGRKQDPAKYPWDKLRTLVCEAEGQQWVFEEAD